MEARFHNGARLHWHKLRLQHFSIKSKRQNNATCAVVQAALHSFTPFLAKDMA